MDAEQRKGILSQIREKVKRLQKSDEEKSESRFEEQKALLQEILTLLSQTQASAAQNSAATRVGQADLNGAAVYDSSKKGPTSPSPSEKDDSEESGIDASSPPPVAASSVANLPQPSDPPTAAERSQGNILGASGSSGGSSSSKSSSDSDSGSGSDSDSDSGSGSDSDSGRGSDSGSGSSSSSSSSSDSSSSSSSSDSSSSDSDSSDDVSDATDAYEIIRKRLDETRFSVLRKAFKERARNGIPRGKWIESLNRFPYVSLHLNTVQGKCAVNKYRFEFLKFCLDEEHFETLYDDPDYTPEGNEDETKQKFKGQDVNCVITEISHNSIPQSASIRQCIGIRTAFELAYRNGDARNLPDNRLGSVDVLKQQFRNDLGEEQHQVFAAKEKKDGFFITVVDSKGEVDTYCVLNFRRDVVSDLLSTYKLDWYKVREYMQPLTGIILDVMEKRSLNEGLHAYLYIKVKHESDRFSVTNLNRILIEKDETPCLTLSTIFTQFTPEIFGKNTPANDRARLPIIDDSKLLDSPPVVSLDEAKYLLFWGYKDIPALQFDDDNRFFLRDLSQLYKKSLPNFDKEYQRYCNPNALFLNESVTDFGQVIQSLDRTLSLAGVMARRFEPGMTKQEFSRNMSNTASALAPDMDLSHTMQVLSQLDLRRGPGSYSDVFDYDTTSAPSWKSSREFLPLYKDCWLDFLKKFDDIKQSLRHAR